MNERDVSTIPSRSQLPFEEYLAVPLVQFLVDVIETILRGNGRKNSLGGIPPFKEKELTILKLKAGSKVPAKVRVSL